MQQLEQQVQQLQQEASTAGALEYRCEGLQQEKQQLAQQLQQLKGMSLSLTPAPPCCLEPHSIVTAIDYFEG